MTARSPTEWLDDIIRYAERATVFAEGYTRESLANDERTTFAVVWCLSVIGEAAKRLPDSIRDRRPALPWRGMARMRDRLVHGYFSVNLDFIWSTLVTDLPILITEARQLQRELSADSPESENA